MSNPRERRPSDAVANERTRLLANPDTEAQDVGKPSSLPFLSTFVLCWARGIEIWIFYGIFPYLPAFVERTGVPKPEVGYYVGIVESIFAVTQFSAMMAWSSISDRYGRKPVLCSCLFGASLSVLAFGFSTEIWHMLVWRALAGVFAASAVWVRYDRAQYKLKAGLTCPVPSPPRSASQDCTHHGRRVDPSRASAKSLLVPLANITDLRVPESAHRGRSLRILHNLAAS